MVKVRFTYVFDIANTQLFSTSNQNADSGLSDVKACNAWVTPSVDGNTKYINISLAKYSYLEILSSQFKLYSRHQLSFFSVVSLL